MPLRNYIILIIIIALAVSILVALFLLNPHSHTDLSSEMALNRYILSQIETLPNRDSIRQVDAADAVAVGTSRDIRYMGQLFWPAEPDNGAYCLGLVFEIFIYACEQYASETNGNIEYRLGSVDGYSFRQFRRDFYQGTGIGGRSMIDALVDRGLGQEITELDNARAGDLVQMSRRNGTSHAAIFQGWAYSDQDERVALHYWGLQGGRFGHNIEYLGDRREQINRNSIYIVRPFLPNAEGGRSL